MNGCLYNDRMAQLTISEVARQAGLRPSAIRYYEQIGILPAAQRVSGQRKYGLSTVYQLTVLRRAQEAGFTLEEIRRLFSGFQSSTPLSARWRELAERKQIELDIELTGIQKKKNLLSHLQMGCQCDTVSECGAAILRGRA
jgi:MerR family redox-sensitive transcriptional activator SoxR